MSLESALVFGLDGILQWGQMPRKKFGSFMQLLSTEFVRVLQPPMVFKLTQSQCVEMASQNRRHRATFASALSLFKFFVPDCAKHCFQTVSVDMIGILSESPGQFGMTN